MSKWIKNWMSNMLEMDKVYVYQGVSYRTSEHFYQAMKLPKDRIDLRAEIAAMTPHKAKTAIRDREKYPWRADWNKEESLRAMEYILKIKFALGTSWWYRLAETGSEPIVETNNWHDQFWGNCICEKCKYVEGQNHLGKILMKIRDE